MGQKTMILFGANGMLGTDLGAVLEASGRWTVVRSDIDDLDITDGAAVSKFVSEVKPDAVINGAAYTQVDKAESQEALATQVNGAAAENIARAAAAVGARLIHISTEYVFDGTKSEPYEEEDRPNPLGAYGRSKLAGEEAIAAAGGAALIVRTAWLYGAHGPNFVATILRLADERDEITMVTDQVGGPTWTVDLAAAIVELLETGATGIVHAVNDGSCSWFGFAQKILELSGKTLTLVPIDSGQLDRPAKRPGNSRMNTDRLAMILGHRLQRWDEALAAFLGR